MWDYSHRRNLNPLTSCPLMRSLVSVGVSVKCLLNYSRLTAGHAGRGRREGRGAAGWMTGCGGRGGGCGGGLASSAVSLVSLRHLAEHSMCSCYGEDSSTRLSLKKICLRGRWEGGCESDTARKNLTKWLRMFLSD